MIARDLLDRVEYHIGDDWSVHEILCVTCPKCGMETIETITYEESTLYYHDAVFGEDTINVCTVNKDEEPIPTRLEPFFEVMPMNF